MARDTMTYEEAAHAMQGGVAFDQASGSKDGSPKHLRTGINSAMCDHAALVRLLIGKGIITEVEYREAVRVEMIREVERYEQRLSRQTGKHVTME